MLSTSITHHSLEVATREAATAARMGANALMVLPPFFLSPGAEPVQADISAIAAEVEKTFLYRHGLIASNYCRAPRWNLDAFHRREIDRLCDEYADWLFAGQPSARQSR